MSTALFVTDLHGIKDRYDTLFNLLEKDLPEVLLIGGDILPHTRVTNHEDFINGYLIPELHSLKSKTGHSYPLILLILGNDDPRSSEKLIMEAENQGYWIYLHQRKYEFKHFIFYGYSYIPPTPFLLKDWERYDVSRFVDPGCLHPTEGIHTKIPDEDIEHATIKNHLDDLVNNDALNSAVCLFHSPPYQTALDRAALDNKSFDHVPLDVHVGSIAIRRFIEEKQPYLTLHGHIHESTSITGSWRDQIGKTLMFNAAHQGPELSIIKFDLEQAQYAQRYLL